MKYAIALALISGLLGACTLPFAKPADGADRSVQVGDIKIGYRSVRQWAPAGDDDGLWEHDEPVGAGLARSAWRALPGDRLRQSWYGT